METWSSIICWDIQMVCTLYIENKDAWIQKNKNLLETNMTIPWVPNITKWASTNFTTYRQMFNQNFFFFFDYVKVTNKVLTLVWLQYSLVRVLRKYLQSQSSRTTVPLPLVKEVHNSSHMFIFQLLEKNTLLSHEHVFMRTCHDEVPKLSKEETLESVIPYS